MKDGSNVECLDIIEGLGLSFSTGNALKYLWRAGRKHEDVVEDLKKAEFYIRQKINNLEANQPS